MADRPEWGRCSKKPKGKGVNKEGQAAKQCLEILDLMNAISICLEFHNLGKRLADL